MELKKWMRAGLPVVLSAAAVVGCGVGSASISDLESGTGDENELRIRPDAGENLARFKVALPTGSCTSGGSCGRPLSANPVITFDGTSLAMGSERRVVRGDHTLVVDGVEQKVTLSAGQRKTLTLAVAHRQCIADPLPTVPATDFGTTVTLGNVGCPTGLASGPTTSSATQFPTTWYYGGSGCQGSPFLQGWNRTQFNGIGCSGWNAYVITGVQGPTGVCRAMSVSAATLCTQVQANNYANLVGGEVALADSDRAYAPGQYRYQLTNSATPVTVTLAEGSLGEVTINLPVNGTLPPLFTTKLVLDDPRELPDAARTTISGPSGERSYELPSTATGTVTLKAFTSNSTYTLRAGGREVALDQTQTNTIHLKRLDIDHVVVTREDGTSYTVTGTYEVYFGGTRVAGPYATDTGIDLLPGAYEVVIKYTTAEGAQIDRYTVTL